MKKQKIIIGISALVLLPVLASCKGDPNYPRTFTVNFITDGHSQSFESFEVKEGYLIEGVGTPTYDIEAIFDGWYTVDDDGNELEYFDINSYRVFDNLTLKAKWTIPSMNPQNIRLGDDAFTKSITWIQKSVTTSDIGVRAKKGEMVYSYAYDANYDKNLISGTEIQYANNEFVDLSGVVNKIDDYHYSFTLDNPENKYYCIEVYSKSSSFVADKANDVHFKGEGTIDNPYLAYTETDLKFITNNNISSDTYVKLMSDITIKSIYSEKTNCVFNGHLEGNKSSGGIKVADNYTITLKNNSGLFMTVGSGATINNVNFRGSISGANPSMGVVANYNHGRITNVDSTAVSVNSQGGVVNDFNSLSKGGAGGIVGTNYKDGFITGCTVSSARDNVISGKIGIGCVAGINYGTITTMRVDGIVGAYNSAEISSTVANSYAGAVVGVNYGLVQKIDVYNGKVNARRIEDGVEGQGASNIGGVAGYNAKDGVIDNCLFDGMRLVGDTNVGGIVGFNDGTITNCYTGRRLRKPSNTAVLERQFISPVIGSYNVGGIAGKCGENSHISNVFSTANVWSYKNKAYTIAEKADHCVGVAYNQNSRAANSYLGQKFGVPYSTDLVQPQGNSVLTVDNSFIVGQSVSWGLGFIYDSATDTFIKNNQLIKRYLTCLGDAFGFRDSASHGIRLMWESSVKSLSELGI